MFKYRSSIVAFVLLTGTILFSSYSSAVSYTYKCDNFGPVDYAYPTYGWVPSEFSITVDRGEVTQMTSNVYMYDLDEITINKATKKVIWLYYKSSNKTSSGATINARHNIKVYPKDNKILYEVTLPGGSVKGDGLCFKR